MLSNCLPLHALKLFQMAQYIQPDEHRGPVGRSAPQKCCRLCLQAGKVPLPAAAPRTPCDGTAPGTGVSQSDPAP